MPIIVKLDCGHRIVLLQTAPDPADGPPSIPAVLYPLDDDNSIGEGDAMTCVVCEETRIVTELAA